MLRIVPSPRTGREAARKISRVISEVWCNLGSANAEIYFGALLQGGWVWNYI